MENRISTIAKPLSKLLLVDDEPFNLDVLEQELEDLGHEIQTAANGQEALDRVAEDPPDMILLDLMMPVLDGFGVLEALQAHPEWRHIPVVIVSAASDMANIVRGIELGAVDFLPKPFEPAVLHARLNSGLQSKRLRDVEQRYLKSLERELEIGREIQAGFLPKEIPQPEGWELEAYFQAAREVAGDFYDVFDVEEGKLGLLLGDVTDKGVGSALYMALFRSLLRAMVQAEELARGSDEGRSDTPPVEGESGPGNQEIGGAEGLSSEPPEEQIHKAINLVNRYICQIHESAMYATLFFGILDTDSGKLCYINAGHDPPYVLRKDGALEQIPPTGPAVGMLELVSFRIETLTLEPGDALVLYSDGVPDANNASDEMFGAERMRSILQASSGLGVCAALLGALQGHLGDAAQYDDITLLVINRIFQNSP